MSFFPWYHQTHYIILNNPEEIKKFVAKIKHSKFTTLVAMEATGGYENVLVNALLKNGIACSVSNPLQVRNFARGCGMIEKNDKIDARMIARFAEVVQPKTKEKPSESEYKLKALVHRRDQILSQLYAENNRKQQTQDPETKHICRTFDGTQSALHGSLGRHPLQPKTRKFLSEATGQRKTKESRTGGRDKETPPRTQRHAQKK
jgi:transposase